MYHKLQNKFNVCLDGYGGAMKLETEFRVCLQLMQLERSLQSALGSSVVETKHPQPTVSTWVKLVRSPNPFCGDEALLLCQYSANQWLAWLPNLGETVLNEDEFYPLSSDMSL